MGYLLGVDVGTTFTAAALVRDGRAEAVTLGTHSVAVPSVVHLAGGEIVVGEAAERRAASDPGGAAREFKRRVGDPTPILASGEPHTAESLMAHMVAWVVRTVATTEGAAPERLTLTHPANWGDYKLGLLGEALGRAGVAPDHLVPEPVAAATFYAMETTEGTGRHVPPGATVAVYDLGGGTFDAAVVQRADGGFRTVGRPEGLEHLGGIDFDHAVFRHVLVAAGIELDELDADHPAMAAAVAQLRRDCVEAKEALSDQTEVSVPVLLPDRPATVVRLARAELERMIRPAINETVTVLRRAIASAAGPPGDAEITDVTAVLLTGGSSRIPLVRQRITDELGLPIVTDARPKDAVSMGAALATAGEAPAWARSGPPSGSPPGPPMDAGDRAGRRPPGAALAAALVVLVAAAAGAAAWLGRDDDPQQREQGESAAAATDGGGAQPYDPATMGPIPDNFRLGGATYRVGSDSTTEQGILTDITELALDAAGATVEEAEPGGWGEGLRNGLVSGELDLYWEYIGYPDGLLLDESIGRATDDVYRWVREQDERYGLVWLGMTAFDANTGVVVSDENAERLGITAISEIGDLIETDPASATVCFVGAEGDVGGALQGVQATYGLVFPSIDYVNDLPPMYAGVGDGTCTFGIGPGTEPEVAEEGLTVLEDDRHHFEPFNAAPRLRAETLEEHPELSQLLAAVAERLDNRTMAELNARVDLHGEDAETVAADWLASTGLVDAPGSSTGGGDGS
jgi:glycine betaine/choline ABC-type transport system substrate-binding protein/actin-like ATPase involved in cell morphogenesis